MLRNYSKNGQAISVLLQLQAVIHLRTDKTSRNCWLHKETACLQHLTIQHSKLPNWTSHNKAVWEFTSNIHRIVSVMPYQENETHLLS